MGRPPIADRSTRKSITLPDSLWQQVADFRFAERIGTEAEAIRRLLAVALGHGPADAGQKRAANRRTKA